MACVEPAPWGCHDPRGFATAAEGEPQATPRVGLGRQTSPSRHWSVPEAQPRTPPRHACGPAVRLADGTVHAPGAHTARASSFQREVSWPEVLHSRTTPRNSRAPAVRPADGTVHAPSFERARSSSLEREGSRQVRETRALSPDRISLGVDQRGVASARSLPCGVQRFVSEPGPQPWWEAQPSREGVQTPLHPAGANTLFVSHQWRGPAAPPALKPRGRWVWTPELRSPLEKQHRAAPQMQPSARAERVDFDQATPQRAAAPRDAGRPAAQPQGHSTPVVASPRFLASSGAAPPQRDLQANGLQRPPVPPQSPRGSLGAVPPQLGGQPDAQLRSASPRRAASPGASPPQPDQQRPPRPPQSPRGSLGAAPQPRTAPFAGWEGDAPQPAARTLGAGSAFPLEGHGGDWHAGIRLAGTGTPMARPPAGAWLAPAAAGAAAPAQARAATLPSAPAAAARHGAAASPVRRDLAPPAEEQRPAAGAAAGQVGAPPAAAFSIPLPGRAAWQPAAEGSGVYPTSPDASDAAAILGFAPGGGDLYPRGFSSEDLAAGASAEASPAARSEAVQVLPTLQVPSLGRSPRPAPWGVAARLCDGGTPHAREHALQHGLAAEHHAQAPRGLESPHQQTLPQHPRAQEAGLLASAALRAVPAPHPAEPAPGEQPPRHQPLAPHLPAFQDLAQQQRPGSYESAAPWQHTAMQPPPAAMVEQQVEPPRTEHFLVEASTVETLPETLPPEALHACLSQPGSAGVFPALRTPTLNGGAQTPGVPGTHELYDAKGLAGQSGGFTATFEPYDIRGTPRGGCLDPLGAGGGCARVVAAAAVDAHGYEAVPYDIRGHDAAGGAAVASSSGVGGANFYDAAMGANLYDAAMGGPGANFYDAAMGLPPQPLGGPSSAGGLDHHDAGGGFAWGAALAGLDPRLGARGPGAERSEYLLAPSTVSAWSEGPPVSPAPFSSLLGSPGCGSLATLGAVCDLSDRDAFEAGLIRS